MSEVYKTFAGNMNNLDFSEHSKIEMYKFESTGKGNIQLDMFANSINGYAYGKKMLNITVAMWKEDIRNRLLFIGELYKDSKFPHWWLDKIFTTKDKQWDILNCLREIFNVL